MDLKLFSDVIDALTKAVNSVKAIGSIPAQQRDAFREALSDSFLVINTVLNMVIVRLHDVLMQENDDLFWDEIGRLGYDQDWMNVEREFRLCSSLRKIRREVAGLRGYIAKQSVQDWDNLLAAMDSHLGQEVAVADAISQSLRQLAEKSWSKSEPVEKVRQETRNILISLQKQRHEFLAAEVRALEAL